MRKTYCEAEMKFEDTTAMDDSYYSSNSLFPNADLTLLKDNKEAIDIGMLALNQFILDGSKTISDGSSIVSGTKPAGTTEKWDIVYMSADRSDENCGFSSDPILEISFTEPHTSSGITLTFGVDYPALIKITYYTMSGTPIISKEFSPDSLIYVCKCQVEDYGKIEIEFIKTRLPDRYIRLQYIMYGIEISWKSADIISATVYDEVDVNSSTLPIGTAKISVIDKNNDFDVQNTNGAWKSLQKTQEVTISEYINGEKYPVGKYYITGMSFSNNIASFEMENAIGLLDKYTFYDGTYYDSMQMWRLIEIFRPLISNIIMDDDVAYTNLTGILEIQTYREALQMICMACNAMAYCDSEGALHIVKADKNIKGTVPTNRKFETKVEQGEYVSGVTIEYGSYTLSSETEEIYNGTLAMGEHFISFSGTFDPKTVTASFGEFVELKSNYAIISLTTENECIISGKKYEETKFSYTTKVDTIEQGETENIKEFGTITLCDTAIIKSMAENILSYYNAQRNLVTIKFVCDNEKAGDYILMEDKSGKNYAGMIKSQNIDLAGGFISEASCVGYSEEVVYKDYAGRDLYAGVEIGVM
jgi:hypothetical protein